MVEKKIDQDKWVLRIIRCEEIITEISRFCKNENIEGGFFYGIGAVSEFEIAHYNVEEKKYLSRKFKKSMEMTSLIGSIGVEDDLIIHAHATFSDEEMNVFGGHLVTAVISGTAEIQLIKLPKLNKKYDSETGLKLLDF